MTNELLKQAEVWRLSLYKCPKELRLPSERTRLIDEAEALISALAEELRRRRWQDIESAPKDGTRVIVYQPYFSDKNTVTWHRKPRDEYLCSAFYDKESLGWFEYQDGDG